MKVLVTGGAGLIGSHTVDHLLAEGFAVRIFDSLELPTHTAGKPDYLAPAAEFIQGDVRDRDALRAALQGIDYVVHLAATGGFTPRLVAYMDANSVGTANLLELIRDEALPVRKILVASSIAVYGEGRYQRATDGAIFYPGLRPVQQLEQRAWEMTCPTTGAVGRPMTTDEATPVEPATAYAISKYDQERLVLNFGRDTGIPTVAYRYFVTYGPRQSLHNPYTGVCTIFASRIANDLPIVIYEDGLQTRDFIFVKDVARANVFALQEERCRDRVFNVGTGTATTMRALSETLQAALGSEAEVQMPDSFRPADVRHMVADVEALGALGFRAEYTLRAGLDEYVGWLREQGPLPEYFSRAQQELQAAGVVRSAK